MTPYDKQRIENAIWTLQKYSEQLEDLDVEILINDVWLGIPDALKVLDLALYKLTK